MVNKTNLILKQVLEKVDSSEDLKIANSLLKEFLDKFKKNIKRLKIDVEVFVGGSFAKKTVIKKDNYDVDIFVRFNKKYENKEISNLTARALKGVQNVSKVHGSRDYFRVKINSSLFFELIPVMKIKNPRDAQNITDLSYSHVKYINKKAKSQKILDEIRIAKAFCYANKCYGAESYIGGFSGYALELLVYYYGNFTKFIRAMVKLEKNQKLVIDIEKHYRTRKIVLMDLNSSKLNSPVILVDPTYKQRNALAALSDETFEKFKKECIKFLKSPSIKSFEIKKTDLGKVGGDAQKKKQEFILLEARTNKQEGDIAGSKLLKFYKYLGREINKFFEVKKKGFNYNHKKSARYFFVVKRKKEILFDGPFISDKRNVARFKKEHKKTFDKKGKIYAREKLNLSVEEFIKKWKKKNKKIIKEMYISDVKIYS